MCKNYAILSDCLNKISVYYEATPLKHDRHDFMGLFRSGSTELIYINWQRRDMDEAMRSDYIELFNEMDYK